jgi:hypothetical protein
MKKVLVVLSLPLSAAVCSVLLLDHSRLSAVTGCCKERESSWTPSWYQVRLNFRDCEDRNREIDGDDVFEQSGLVWWDVVC